jgi:hypothetical protein
MHPVASGFPVSSATGLCYIYVTILSILAKIHEDAIFPATYLLTNSFKIKFKIVLVKYMKAYGEWKY